MYPGAIESCGWPGVIDRSFVDPYSAPGEGAGVARIPAATGAVAALHFLVAAAIAAIEGVEHLAASCSPAVLLDRWELEDKISQTLLLVQVRDKLPPSFQGDELTQ